jgi:hypothetical protein
MISSFNGSPFVALSRLVVVHCSALARTTSAGVTHARAALPASPARQGSSRHRRTPHRAHRKVARFQEPVPSPQHHQDDYSSSESDDESTSGSESDRFDSSIKLVRFFWSVWVARCALAPVASFGSPQAASVPLGLDLILESLQF